MKTREMSAQNLEDRRVFLEELSQAGWDVEGWSEALDAGASVDPEAEAEYKGPMFDLRLEYHAKPRQLTLGMVQRDGPAALRLQIRPSDDLAPLLAQIIAMQGSLDAENYPSLVKSLIPYSAPLLIETDDGLFQLTE